MSISDSLMGLIPDAYRRDAIVLGLGLALGSGWWHLSARIDTAYAASQTTQTMQKEVDRLAQHQAILEAQSATTQSNSIAIKEELDSLVIRLIGAQPLPTAQAVPSKPKQ